METTQAKNYKTFIDDNSQMFFHVYLEDEKMRVGSYHGSFSVTDISNALKRGKSCQRYTIKHNDDLMAFNFVRSRYDYDIRKMFAELEALDWSKVSSYGCLQWEGFEVYKSANNAIRTFSPFALAEIKPLKEAPSKWTIPHAIRAIVNGQFEYLKCRQVLTDDYAYDNAVNFQKGEIKHSLAFAQRIIESPSGWWVSDRYNDAGVVSICCHSFDSNEFKFSLSGKKTEKIALRIA